MVKEMDKWVRAASKRFLNEAWTLEVGRIDTLRVVRIINAQGRPQCDWYEVMDFPLYWDGFTAMARALQR